MAITGYLKIPDIAGESKRAEHEDEIDIHGISWGVSRETSAIVGRGRRRGRAEVDALTVLKYYDASSPYLTLATLQGKSFDEIVLSVRQNSGDASHKYLTITMTNCVFTSYDMENEGVSTADTLIAEAISIEFESVRTLYVVQADDHSAGDEHEIEFDVAAMA